MLLILDPCSLSLSPEPTGGVVIRITEVEGLKDCTLLVPVAKEAAEKLHEAMGEFIHKVKPFNLNDVKKEARHAH